MSEWIKNRGCKTAEDFLTALSSHTPDSLYTGRSFTWLFRGQSRDKPLLPSAHRASGRTHLMRLMRPGQVKHPALTPSEQRAIEFQAFGRFAALADAEGYEVPGDSHRIRFPPLLKVPDGRFPPEEYVGMAALAQHHGVPTCVLDWTRDSRMGAYFAAARACSHIFQQLDEARRDRSGTGDLESHFRQQQLVVYALNVECLQTLIHSHFDASNDWEWDPLVRMVTVPYTSNPNLRRQRGVFTLVQPQDANVWPPPPLDEALQAGYESFRKSDPEGADALPEHPLQRFTLSWREARRLLFFLGQQGVTAASVYEGRDAVFKAMEESSMMTTTIPGVSPGA